MTNLTLVQTLRFVGGGHPTFGWGKGAQQVPPLRYAPVGMTSSFKIDDFEAKDQKVTTSLDDKG